MQKPVEMWPKNMHENFRSAWVVEARLFTEIDSILMGSLWLSLYLSTMSQVYSQLWGEKYEA